ncbi:hypothetical protein [Novipirellula herctigrandis]
MATLMVSLLAVPIGFMIEARLGLLALIALLPMVFVLIFRTAMVEFGLRRRSHPRAKAVID